MNTTDRTATNEIERTLDREVELLMSALNLVASRGAPAATVAGLRLAEAAMAIVGPRASECGLIMEPLWGPDEHVYGVRVRRPPTD